MTISSKIEIRTDETKILLSQFTMSIEVFKMLPEFGAFSLRLQQCKKDLVRARREFDAKLFFIVVIGALKAGKSTLVNVLSRANVSPTGYGKETTKRPSIIISSDQSEFKMVEYYYRENALRTPNPEESKKEIFNLVIDQLREIGDDKEFEKKVTAKCKTLNKEQLKYPNDASKSLENDAADNLIITVIYVPGGEFFKQGVALLDMPGLDGEKSNATDQHVHKWVLERTDFLLMIQNSMAALNKPTLEFIKNVVNADRQPILWLIQNEIESAWRNKEWQDTGGLGS